MSWRPKSRQEFVLIYLQIYIDKYITVGTCPIHVYTYIQIYMYICFIYVYKYNICVMYLFVFLCMTYHMYIYIGNNSTVES